MAPALPPLPARPTKYADVYVWSCVNLSETLPDPVSPMGWSLLESGIRVLVRPLRIANAAGYSVFEFLYGRAYWNLTPFFGSRFLFGLLDRNLEAIGPSVRGTMREIFRSGRVRPRPLYTASQKLILALQVALLAPWIAAKLALLALTPGTVERGLERLEFDLRGRAAAPATDGWRASVRELDRYLAWAFAGLKRRFGPAGLLVLSVAGFFALVASRLLKSRSLAETMDLVTPARPTKTAEADLALWEVVCRADSLTADSPAFRNYLERYGHRTPGEQDVLAPRPWDDPEAAFRRILEMAGTRGAGSSPAEGFADRMLARREAAESRLRAAGPLRRMVAGPLRGAASRFFPIREDGKHYLMLIFGGARRRLTVVGHGLTEEGVTDAIDDVFYLTVSELSKLARDERIDTAVVRSQIAERRREAERYRDVRPPLVVTSDGIPESPVPAAGETLRGDPVSPGRARGRVRIVTDPVRDGRIEPGEILVATHTDPGWTPLFLRAAAVVTEVGGALSHVAVVAREFGLPAVVNVADATKLLRTGDMIEVDGDCGEVRRR